MGFASKGAAALIPSRLPQKSVLFSRRNGPLQTQFPCLSV